jgi:hypothetical protein
LILGFQEEELLEALVDEIARIVQNPEVKLLHIKPKLDALVQNLRAIGPEELRKHIISEIRRLAPKNADLFKKPLYEFLNYWKRLIPRMRIISLSEVNDSMSMWRHYADKHRGVVLALDCIEEIESPWLIARRVIYQNDPPLLAKETLIRLITGQQSLDYKQFCLDCMHIKKTDWAYEKEWRVVTIARVGEDDLYSDWAIHPRNFGSIYLGHEISEENEKDILAILDYELSHMSVYKSIYDSKACRLRFNKIR